VIKQPLIIIDDDEEDHFLYRTAFEELNITSPLKFFSDGTQALRHLKGGGETPFIILCDIKMPKMGGLELREAIYADPELERKSIPFIFITGSAEEKDVNHAYSLSVQGFFTKPETVADWKVLMELIVSYWSRCLEPNRKKTEKF
jgi:CheY-like chemotaxis protein